MIRRAVVLIGIATLALAACSDPPDPATANEPCSAFLDTHDDTHRAVTEHMGALMLAIWTDAKAGPGAPRATSVKKFIGHMDDAQLHAADLMATSACRLSPTISVMAAVTDQVGSGRLPIPDPLRP